MADVKDEKREGKSKKVLGPKDLALYLGCCVALHREAGIQDLGDPLILHGITQAKNDMPEAAIVDVKFFPCYQVKPILRPFSDMNKKEYAQCKKKCRIVYHEGTRIEADCPEYNMFLLSRYFDLFGWIDAGLAIDATTLSPNPYSKMSKVEGQKSKTSDLRPFTFDQSNIKPSTP